MSARTVRVRIGVAVDENGKWSAVGWTTMPDDELYGAADGVDSPVVRYFWLEADLPKPEVETRQVQEAIEAPAPPE